MRYNISSGFPLHLMGTCAHILGAKSISTHRSSMCLCTLPSQVTVIYTVLLTMQIVSKQLHNIK